MDAPDGEEAIAFEALHALPGFCVLGKRSPTLDGSLPLRAAQHCAPVFEGNAAGFQISLVEPLTLRRTRRGVHVSMTPSGFDATQEEAPRRIEQLARSGVLRRGGYWHRLLAREALPVRGSRLHLWTGYLVRPLPGVCLRVGRAFNRRSRIAVVDHAIADATAFTPLVLEIDGRELGDEPLWVEREIGCVLPVAPATRMRVASIRSAPAVVRSFESFFDAPYFEMKKRRPTGKYRRMMRTTSSARVPTTCDADVYFGGPAVHTVSALTRFHGPAGVSTRAADGVALPHCTVRNTGAIDAFWDGQCFTREATALDDALRLFRRDWSAARGRPSSVAFEALAHYFHPAYRDDPYWLLHPWVFTVTPPGWSTVVEGSNVARCDGMRGIIRTDRFHAVSMVYRMYGPGAVRVPRRAPLLRFFPIPRRLQDASVRTSTI